MTSLSAGKPALQPVLPTGEPAADPRLARVEGGGGGVREPRIWSEVREGGAACEGRGQQPLPHPAVRARAAV